MLFLQSSDSRISDVTAGYHVQQCLCSWTVQGATMVLSSKCTQVWLQAAAAAMTCRVMQLSVVTHVPNERHMQQCRCTCAGAESRCSDCFCSSRVVQLLKRRAAGTGCFTAKPVSSTYCLQCSNDPERIMQCVPAPMPKRSIAIAAAVSSSGAASMDSV